MRRESTELASLGEGVKSRGGARGGAAKRSRLRRLTLDSLEQRTLMATSPISVVTGQAQVSTGSQTIDDSSPWVAIDPLNPLKMVSVFTRRDTTSGTVAIYAVAKASTDGGKSWPLSVDLGRTLNDPTTSNPVKSYPTVNGSGVGFDQNENVYIGLLETNGSTSGAVVVQKYLFSGGSPVRISPSTGNIAYQWNQSEANNPAAAREAGILNVNLAVDDNVATYTDPNTGQTQTDPTAGTVFLAWTTVTPAPNPAPNPFNPNTIELTASPDGTFPTVPMGTDNATPLSRDIYGPPGLTEPRIAIGQGAPGGQGGQATVIWDDFGTGATATPPFDIIQARTATYGGQDATTGAPILSLNSISTVASTYVRGAAAPNYPIASPASPIGIGPGATIAIDNTLGSFSPHEGRIYVAFTQRYNDPLNQSDNTDINLTYSDNGGSTWSTPVQINDDSGAHDGHTSGVTPSDYLSAHYAGRSQFEPSVAVDKATGTVALSWLDARDDASRTRYADYLTTSTDGGQSFAVNTFANQPNLVTDAITGKKVVVGPYTDNPTIETSLGAGTHQALAIANGVVHPVWVTTLKDGLSNAHQTIETAQATYQYGPRILSSTMGPVAAQTMDGTTFNASFSPTDHTQRVDGFAVTFDRPVDIATFTAGDVRVFYRSVTAPLATAGTPIALDPSNPVTALDPGAQFPGEATTFFVKFATPQSAVGTYSYSVGPNIRDRLRVPSKIGLTPDGTLATQTANPAIPIPDSPARGVTSTIDIAPVAPGEVVAHVSVQVNISHPIDSDLNIVLVSPQGVRVTLANGHGGQGANYNNTTFDDSAALPIGAGSADFQGSYRPDQPLSVLNSGQVSGTWSLIVTDQHPGFTGTLNSWSLTITTGTTALGPVLPGNNMDQNANGVPGEARDAYSAPTAINATPFQGPFDTTTEPIIIPGPHVTGSFVPGSTARYDNLVTDSTVSFMDVVFDRDINPATFTADQILSMIGPNGAINGPFTVAADPANKQADEDATHVRTFRIGFPTQQISGTYQITLGTNIRSTAGDAVDTNLNAGLNRLFDPFNPASTATTDVFYSAPNLPATGAITANNTTTSSIRVTDGYTIQDVKLSLNITYPNDPDLEATLTFQPTDANGVPNGPLVGPITLFQNLGNIGATGTRGNFNDTIFTNNPADTPIQNGAPPYFGRFTPQGQLSGLLGLSAQGIFTLSVKNDAAGGANTSGSLNNFTVTLTRSADAGVGTGLGEPVADRSQVSFRIFTMDPTNPLSSNTWTAVGPASNNGNGNSSRVTGLALDPSDPSGNTAFVGGASGGIWKTTNFLTTAAGGPTYVPLTDFGPTFAINIGSIAVFARNNDPNQSIVVASTGEGDTGSTGVGFLISYNGGKTWSLLDSTANVDANGVEIPAAQRDHAFVGTTSFKVLIDPHPTPTGDIIIYAALAGTDSRGNARGGVWRSLDSGRHWARIRAGSSGNGDATDIVFDPNSGSVDAFSNPTGNIRTLYAGFRGDGVYSTPNQGGTWNLLAGNVGDPLIQDSIDDPTRPIPVGSSPTPNGSKGRIVLAKPELTGNAIQDVQYETWLYAMVATADGALDGLYMTKDNGQNWTKVRLAGYTTKATRGELTDTNATNDITQPDYNLLGDQGNYNIALAIDPNNPNVVYMGGTHDFVNGATLIRVDTTRLADAHSLFVDPTRNGGGTLENTTSPVTIKDPKNLKLFGIDPISNPYLNLVRRPNAPFLSNANVFVTDTQAFSNDGSGAWWTPFDNHMGGTDIHRFVTIRDQATGKTRLIVGLDQGVFTEVDRGDGTYLTSVGTQTVVNGSLNGNLQINQFYNGAAQPGALAAAVAGALFYGMAQDNGFPVSTDNVDKTVPNGGGGQVANGNYGNLTWYGSTGDGQDVATDQTGSGTSYSYRWPCCGGAVTNFFQVAANGGASVGRTFGLIQQSQTGVVPDPQWPELGGFNFAVNPISGNQIIIGSGAGRLFSTENQGRIWHVIADPSALDGTVINGLAYGAPDPNGPGVPGALNNYLLVGTSGGHIYATFVGGGTANGSAWLDISNGLNGESVQRIVTNPNRGSHEAYAITTGHVYHNADTSAANSVWVDITGDIASQMINPFGDASQSQPLLSYLQGLAVDWRYVIPDKAGVQGGTTHPMLYVAGEGGVYRSTDNGQTWRTFPDLSLNTPAPGGYLPNVHVTDLDMVLGNVNPTTGRPDVSTGPNLLLATTYGRGSFGIRLAPIVFNDAVNKVTATTDASGKLVFNGLSEQTAFGNAVTITITDVTDPAHPISLGTSMTDAFGKFTVSGAYPLAPANNPYLYNGIRTVQVFATDASGTKGNVVNFQITNNPATPAAPVIVSNHLVSGSLAITDAVNPTFSVTIPNNTTVPVQVTLIRIDNQGVPTNVAVATITGTGTIQDPGPVPIGTYGYEVQYSANGGTIVVTSPPSAPTSVQIVAPITAALNPADDSGIKGDNKTNITQPRIFGIAPIPPAAGLLLDLVQVTSTSPYATRVLATIADPNDGNYVIAPLAPLPDGNITLFVQARDASGNTLQSNPVVLTIKTVSSAADPTIGILPADDTPPVGDGRTIARRPHIVGIADPGAVVQIIDLATGNVQATVTASGTASNGNPAGYYSAQLPFDLSNGTIRLEAKATDVEGNPSKNPAILNLTIYGAPGDYNLDGKADLAVYRPSTGQWTVKYSGGSSSITSFGWPGHDIPIQGDFFGNGLADIAVFRPETDQWIVNGGNLGTTVTQFGWAGHDTPVPAAYDSGGRTEIAIYRAEAGLWAILHSNGTGQEVVNYGWPLHDKPVPANYDGNGFAQVAVYRPLDVASAAQGGGAFYVRNVTNGATETFVVAGAKAGDIPVPADYDGIGRDEPALYRPSTGQYLILNPVTSATRTVSVGVANDIPVPRDYDGDGKVDPGVYHPANSVWTYVASTTGQPSTFQFGQPMADVAVAGPLQYRVNAVTGGKGVGVPAAESASDAGSGLIAPTPPTIVPSAVVVGAPTPTAPSIVRANRRVNDAPAARGPLVLTQKPSGQVRHTPHDVALTSLHRPVRGRFIV